MQRRLHTADGKVFTLTTMDSLIAHTRIRVYNVR